jgi:hypothetical protein
MGQADGLQMAQPAQQRKSFKVPASNRLKTNHSTRMKSIVILVVLIIVSAREGLHASVPEIPVGQFVCALSSESKEPPIASISSIEAGTSGEYVLRIRDWYRNPCVVPIRFRPILIQTLNGPQTVLAFEGAIEHGDKKGGAGLRSFRVSGVVAQDGSVDGTMVEFTTPGYDESARESVNVRAFKMRSLAAEQAAPPLRR